jgi:hypothetical protein
MRCHALTEVVPDERGVAHLGGPHERRPPAEVAAVHSGVTLSQQQLGRRRVATLRRHVQGRHTLRALRPRPHAINVPIQKVRC